MDGATARPGHSCDGVAARARDTSNMSTQDREPTCTWLGPSAGTGWTLAAGSGPDETDRAGIGLWGERGSTADGGGVRRTAERKR